MVNLIDLPIFAGGEFIGSVPFFILMAVVLIGLIGLLIFMRSRRDDDDD